MKLSSFVSSTSRAPHPAEKLPEVTTFDKSNTSVRHNAAGRNVKEVQDPLRLHHQMVKGKKNARSDVISGPTGTYKLIDNTGILEYVPDFLTKDDADAFFERTRNSKSWERRPIILFGKTVVQPRATALFGTKPYKYSSCDMQPLGWDEDLPASEAIKQVGEKIERYLGEKRGYFNTVLCNRYENGIKDYMGFHSDDEKSLGVEPIIASISVGAMRRFVLRPKEGVLKGDTRRIEYWLQHGSLLIMKGRTQECWKHALPKDKSCHDLRLNFTYRHIVSQ